MAKYIEIKLSNLVTVHRPQLTITRHEKPADLLLCAYPVVNSRFNSATIS